jgi:hypothetical protein
MRAEGEFPNRPVPSQPPEGLEEQKSRKRLLSPRPFGARTITPSSWLPGMCVFLLGPGSWTRPPPPLAVPSGLLTVVA